MAEVLGEVGGELFSYNREGWKFGAELRQRDLYQRQKMRIKQVDLYRDDIRDLFDLTVGKMDKYVIVCLVMLGITMELYYKGRNPVGTPSWLFWCWSICTAGAMFYLLMAIWLALHASISAQTYSVRCLTQWLRLPIPSPKEVADGATKLEKYETEGKLLRVPVFGGKGDDKSNGVLGTNTQQDTRHDLTTEWQLFTSHFTLFNVLHRMWQAHESYARVCMCIGMNQFLFAMSYFSLAVYAIELGTPWSGWAFTAMFQAAAVLHARLNLNMSSKENMAMISLLVLPTVFLSVAVAVVMTGNSTNMEKTQYDLGPCSLAGVGIVGHIAWVLFFLYQTKSDNNGLPVKFSTVWCIDVLGFGVETLREVQEPVGKETYASRLPGYHRGGPANAYGDGTHRFDNITLQPNNPDIPVEPGAGGLMPDSADFIARTNFPWKAFKMGSALSILLWVIALAHTIATAITSDPFMY